LQTSSPIKSTRSIGCSTGKVSLAIKETRQCYGNLSAATVERDAIPLAFLCWNLTNVTRFSRSGSRIYCRRKHLHFVCPL
jgi:hypothetical protein